MFQIYFICHHCSETLVAVTKYDSFYEEADDSTADEITEKISEVAKPSKVFPICTKWALKGRMASGAGKISDEDQKFLDHALTLYQAKLNGENADNWEAVKASGIHVLEARYYIMSKKMTINA